jgi:hypothetical protein
LTTYTNHQYTTTNRGVKHLLLLSKFPIPSYDPTRIPNGRTRISTKWELKKTEEDVKREQVSNPKLAMQNPYSQGYVQRR